MAAARMRDSVADVKPRSDVYTGLLGISLAALVVACVLVFLDWSEYKDTKPPKPTIQVPTAQKEQPAAQPQPGQQPMP
jgi:hypothetical protein